MLCALQYGREKFQTTQNAIFPASSQSWFQEICIDQAFPKRHILTRNKLLKLESPLPNVCQPLTMQEAERRILQEGEALFALSQEDGVTFAHPASTLNAALTFNAAAQTQTCNMPKSTMGTSIHQGISSTEGLKRPSCKLSDFFILKILL